jgi:hypothetical protein
MSQEPVSFAISDSAQPDSDREHRIRLRAFALWEADGKPDGRDTEYWFAAESEEASSVQEPLSISPAEAAAAAPATSGAPR